VPGPACLPASLAGLTLSLIRLFCTYRATRYTATCHLHRTSYRLPPATTMPPLHHLPPGLCYSRTTASANHLGYWILQYGRFCCLLLIPATSLPGAVPPAPAAAATTCLLPASACLCWGLPATPAYHFLTGRDHWRTATACLEQGLGDTVLPACLPGALHMGP